MSIPYRYGTNTHDGDGVTLDEISMCQSLIGMVRIQALVSAGKLILLKNVCQSLIGMVRIHSRGTNQSKLRKDSSVNPL